MSNNPLMARTMLGKDQQAALATVVEMTEALNAAVAKAVETGLVVEVSRTCRYHNGRSAWGDQLAPVAYQR